MTPIPLTDSIEWLEPDGWGGFASGTASGVRTRRYHALLLTATTPPTGRFVLVNGLEAWVETGGGRRFLSEQRYVPDVIYPDGMARLASFVDDPWPTWRWRLESGEEITLELFVPHGISACVLCWKLTGPSAPASLFVRPLLSGRDYHSLQRENAAFRFKPELRTQTVVWRPYDKIPSTTALSNGVYRQDPEWYRNFVYVRETERGLDHVEDLASPGVFSWSLRSPAILVLAAEGALEQIKRVGDTAEAVAAALRDEETRRRASVRQSARSLGRRLYCPARAAVGSGDSQDGDCRLSLVYGLGTRHVPLAPRSVPGNGPVSGSGRNPPRLGPNDFRGHASQPVSRHGRHTRVQRG